MLDIKFIRENPEKVKQAVKNKGLNLDVDQIIALDTQRKKLMTEIENLRAKQNKLSKTKPSKNTIGQLKDLKKEISIKDELLKLVDKDYQNLLYLVPNLPLENIKIGKDESENIIIKEIGERPEFKFKPKDYLTLSENLDLVDIERAGKVSGARFSYLKRELAQLEFAIIQYTFSELMKDNFITIIPPVMIKDQMMKAMGYLEYGGEAETYHLEKDDLYLVGTSEQSVGPMHSDEILDINKLPLRYAAFSSCFRREAGSYGKDTKGILRVHQFDKVEMFSYSHPDKSYQEYKFLIAAVEKLVNGLKIPYRIIEMCTGDLGLPAAAKTDIECWMPGQGQYRETHSISTCTDFQARRLNIKYKEEGKLKFVHTLNGTAFAIGRTLIAIIENYQNKDGSINVPGILQKYVDFKEIKV